MRLLFLSIDDDADFIDDIFGGFDIVITTVPPGETIYNTPIIQQAICYSGHQQIEDLIYDQDPKRIVPGVTVKGFLIPSEVLGRPSVDFKGDRDYGLIVFAMYESNAVDKCYSGVHLYYMTQLRTVADVIMGRTQFQPTTTTDFAAAIMRQHYVPDHPNELGVDIYIDSHIFTDTELAMLQSPQYFKDFPYDIYLYPESRLCYG